MADPAAQPAPARNGEWIALATQIQTMPITDLAKLDASTRESILIGLRTIPGPVASAARDRIASLPKA